MSDVKVSTAIDAIFERVATLALAMCGATIAFGSLSSSLSAGSGSGSVTSSAANPGRPAFNAAINAA